ncbi:MAG: hypothetical protein R3E64_04135 [Halioglobus sp.]
MNYADFRHLAETGDLLLLEGRGLFSTPIRMITGQQASHVAILLWIADGLWVAEMRGQGYTLMRASQRVSEMGEHGQVYWGKAPYRLRWQVNEVRDAALSYRGYRYSWWTLITVWLSQVTRRRMPSNLVCSTLVQRVWSAAGFQFTQTPDPGDFFKLCAAVTPLHTDATE